MLSSPPKRSYPMSLLSQLSPFVTIDPQARTKTIALWEVSGKTEDVLKTGSSPPPGYYQCILPYIKALENNESRGWKPFNNSVVSRKPWVWDSTYSHLAMTINSEKIALKHVIISFLWIFDQSKISLTVFLTFWSNM